MCMYINISDILIIDSSIVGCLDHFHISTIVLSAAMNMDMYMNMYMYIYMGINSFLYIRVCIRM